MFCCATGESIIGRNGARFQAVDLRWGISREAGEDQQTLDICLREVERCQRLTPRPNFLILLGERYGWRPLPPRIPIEDFDVLHSAVESNVDRCRLRDVYARDDNWLGNRSQASADNLRLITFQ